jgi:hypothetical protein
MGVYPTEYNKEKFIGFLKKNHVNEGILEKFNDIPEKVKKNSYIYKLNIIVTWYSIGDTFYNFELNYYSEELNEYLFSLKMFTNVEESINNLLCDLIAAKYIEKRENSKTC